VHTDDITLGTPDGPMRVHIATPDGDAQSAVIVIPEAFGLNDHIEDVTRRFANAGYIGVGLDIFHRSGKGTAPYDDFSKALELFEAVSDDTLLGDVDAAIVHLREMGITDNHIGLVGFCFGGRTSFLVAVRRAIGASVGFYGGGIVTARFPQFPALVDEVPQLKTPWLGLFGDADTGIPTEDVERLRAELDENATVDHAVMRYADAEHGFHCDVRPSYHEDAAKDAWARTLEWFAPRL
jgi:carboxymethylenebutenolidase